MANLRWATAVSVILAAGLFVYVAAATVWAFIRPAAPAAHGLMEYPVAAVMIGGLAILIGSSRSPIVRLPVRTFLVAALVAFVLSRLLWVLLVPTEPVNDFLVLHNLAGTLAKGQPIPRIADRGNWPIFMYTWGYCLALGGVYAAFGKTVLVGQAFNVALGALTLSAVYAFTRIVANDRAARGVAVLFLIWPSQIMMTNVIAAEHLALAAAALALWLLASTLADTAHGAGANRRALARLLVAGAVLAVAYLSRFPLLVVLIAVLMTLVFANGLTWRARAGACSVLAGFLIVNVSYHAVLRQVYEVRLPARSIAGNLVVGVSVEGGGGWNEPDWRKLVTFPTMESASAWAMQESLQRIRSRPLAVFGLMVRKVAVYWRADDYGVLWGVERGVRSNRTGWYLPPLYHAALFYHLGVVLLGLCGALLLAMRGARDPALNLVLLPLIGSTALHSLLEVQSRYHFPFEPLLFVLTAIGAAGMMDAAESMRAHSGSSSSVGQPDGDSSG